MRIGFIGSGNIGSTVAQLAVNGGHEVVLSNSRGPETLADLLARLGPNATAGTPAEAAAAGDLVVVAIPLKAYRDVPVEPLVGKVVLDTNNYYAQRDGNIAELDDGSSTSSELLAAHLRGARVVKAFNTLRYLDLAARGLPSGDPQRLSLPIAGDDLAAKRIAAELIATFGYDTVDAGPLAEGRRFEPGTPASGALLTHDDLVGALAAA
jgi:predicted dinucleotide-binding enzyme